MLCHHSFASRCLFETTLQGEGSIRGCEDANTTYTYIQILVLQCTSVLLARQVLVAFLRDTMSARNEQVGLDEFQGSGAQMHCLFFVTQADSEHPGPLQASQVCAGSLHELTMLTVLADS